MKTLANRAPVALCALVLLAACGGEPAPVAPPAPTVAPLVTVPAATVAPEATPPTPSALASASSSAKVDMPPAPKPEGSGRTAVLMSDPAELTGTFGSGQGAKLELGDKDKMTLRIPDSALEKGTVVIFKLDPKGKAGGGLLGKIVHITTVVPPETTPSEVTSAGKPFELQMPAGNKKDANLAIGTITTDDKGREKLTWKVIAPKRIDDALGIAYFELPTLNDSFLHVTTKAPSK